MAQATVDVDTAENRLYLELAGHMTESDAKAAVDDIEAAVDQLSAGFEIINDLAEFKPASSEAVAYVEEAKTYAADGGCGAVVRIQPESPTGQMQFERAEGEDYEVAVAGSVEEAEQLLETR